MTKQEAINYLLENYDEKVIKDIYDFDNVSEAILTVFPEFEYPEWDYSTINDFLFDIGEK